MSLAILYALNHHLSPVEEGVGVGRLAAAPATSLAPFVLVVPFCCANCLFCTETCGLAFACVLGRLASVVPVAARVEIAPVAELELATG